MTELERELTREHFHRWRRSRKSRLEILAGLLTIVVLLLLIASLAHAASVMERHMADSLPPPATAWACARQASSSQTSGPVRFIINGKELTKDDGSDFAKLTQIIFQIVLNNQYGIVAISPEANKYSGDVIEASVSVVIINKKKRTYLETTLVSPASDAGRQPENPVERGTCIAG